MLAVRVAYATVGALIATDWVCPRCKRVGCVFVTTLVPQRVGEFPCGYLCGM